MLQEFVVDVLAVGGEDGASADEAAQDGQRSFQDGQAEGNYRDSDSHDGWGFLRALESQRAQDKADEQASGVTQKNGCGIEVVTQEAENRTGQRDGHDGDEGGSV